MFQFAVKQTDHFSGIHLYRQYRLTQKRVDTLRYSLSRYQRDTGELPSGRTGRDAYTMLTKLDYFHGRRTEMLDAWGNDLHFSTKNGKVIVFSTGANAQYNNGKKDDITSWCKADTGYYGQQSVILMGIAHVAAIVLATAAYLFIRAQIAKRVNKGKLKISE